MITEQHRQEVATSLAQAARERAPIPPITETWPGFDVDDAYAVQTLVIDERVGSTGARRVGWKVGLTSAAMQRQLGVDQPDFGPLLTDMQAPCGGTIETSGLIAPRVEGEIAFRLARDLAGPGITVQDVADAVVIALPALEIIDSRIADWKIALADTIADHASSAMFVVAADGTPLDGLDLQGVEMALLIDGEEVDRGVGRAVLGDPLEAVAWLANTLGEYGERLSARDVVLAGALHASVPVRPGMRVEARFSDAALGSVSVSFA
jgi:2-keto-4-pentenoate hydratase